MVTGLYAAILACIQIWLSVDVIKLRRALRVSIGDGGHDSLARRIRIHGNFIETVPICLILIGICELSGAPLWSLHALGIMLIAGRIAHRQGIITHEAPMKFRVGGMALTFTVMALSALLAVFLYFTVSV
jgi:uncharacterized membrane protein YecN with MAPEG domain